MSFYHFSIHGPMQNEFPNEATAFARDLNWVMNNSAKIAKVRKSGKKVNCYINWGRLQADPNKNSNAAFPGVYKYYSSLIPKNKKGGYEMKDVTCKSKGDKWGEPWWNLKAQYRPQLMKAWGAMFNEARQHCDGVELDNPDVYDHVKDGSCGNRRDSVEAMKEVCKVAHQSGRNCVLRNMFDDANELAPYVDAAVGEQCVSWGSRAVREPPNFQKYAYAFGKKKPAVCIEYKNMDIEANIGGAYERNFAADCRMANDAGIALVVERKQSVQGDPLQMCPGTSPSQTAQETTNTAIYAEPEGQGMRD
jgi:hypothetical protein